MHDIGEVAPDRLPPAQAAELAQLVESEARWENLRGARAAGPAPAATQTLLAVQKAYETFHTRLVAYNKRYTPAHVPERLLNTPARLGLWCRAMRDLYRGVGHDPQTPGPVHLLEKAYRLAERMSARANAAPLSRPASPNTVRAAVEELGALALWCEGLEAAPVTA
jgi:hypothetical protein